MAGSTILKGQARSDLISETSYTVNSGGQLLGVFNTAQYARFAGMFTGIGSVTVQYKMGVTSATVGTANFAVTSSFVVNSGGAAFDVLNYGMVTEFRLSAANSQVANAVLIYGEPIR